MVCTSEKTEKEEVSWPKTTFLAVYFNGERIEIPANAEKKVKEYDTKSNSRNSPART